MKCFNCGKNFDFEKCYGVCPKCGCFNKFEASQGEPKGKGDRGYTIFLIFSLVCFLTVSIGGSIFIVYYRNQLGDSLEQEMFDMEIPRQEHELGESFAYQGTTLMFEEARTLDWEEAPLGKKLIAVKLAGESKVQGERKNEILSPYIQCKDLYYYYVFDDEIWDDCEEQYGIYGFDAYGLCRETYAEGWYLFLVDKNEQEFTLHLEENGGEGMLPIQTIHLIKIRLGEERANEQNN